MNTSNYQNGISPIVESERSLITSLYAEECELAIKKWEEMLSSFSEIKKSISFQSLFHIEGYQFKWLQKHNRNSEKFCVEMGVFAQNIVMILVPLDEFGNKIELDSYECSLLSTTNEELVLREKKIQTTVKSYTFTKDNKKLVSEEKYGEEISKPRIDLETAAEAIELWRNEGENWFNTECVKYKGKRIFRKFYVPFYDLNIESVDNVTCSFALKYSGALEKILPTLIFVMSKKEKGFPDDWGDLLDWSQPCPPLCPHL
ncbi:hypothetical protein LPB85_20005 [Chryseobacterium sp. LC2016-27]|uniref:hypothetical protein n=1 Tax=Chryseobacterium sp. LC2016-27 TaxID=2897326 RepID=UPI001E4A8A22|nr:hypothetical protein [Chryseobacterium sp. LC2016-27]MCD0457729.1 hypothetical protein [Chryseobacterium sp. LC2016-27]